MIDTVLLNGLWQGGLIVAIAALIVWRIPQRHAATRYAVWFVALTALVATPIASLWHAGAAIASLPVPMEHTASAPSLVTAKAASVSGTWLLYFWFAGAAVGLTRLALSHAHITHIVRHAEATPELGPNVVTSNDIDFPIAAGIVTPLIVLPAHLVATLERSELDDIVRHERAHIERRDILGNFVQRVIEALLFFNPWAYFIGRRLIHEREAACDDRAVHATGEPDRYASCLARLAQRPRRARAPLLTPSAIGSRRMLVQRIARLLNGKASELKANYVVLAASALAFAMLAALLQTANGLAAGASPAIGADVAVAASPCVFPSNVAANTPAEKATLHQELLGTGADVKILDPVAPDIPKPAFRPNTAVSVLVTVSPEGRPISAKVVLSSGSAGMDRAVVKAALASTYSPAMNACKFVTGQYLFKAMTGPM